MWQWLVYGVGDSGALSVETGYGEVADLFVALAPCPLPRHHCLSSLFLLQTAMMTCVTTVRHCGTSGRYH